MNGSNRAPLFPVSLGPPSEALDLIEYHLLSVSACSLQGTPRPLDIYRQCRHFLRPRFRRYAKDGTANTLRLLTV
jgi:hypothetical protein